MGKESMIQSKIIKYLYDNGHWFERINSGSAFVGAGSFKKRITLARRGCPDIVACISGKFVGIEIKKDEKEYKRWLGIVERYKKAKEDKTEIKKSWEREIHQYEYALDIHRSGGNYILTYSVEHLQEQLKKLK